ncbi:thermonuclease family protein [Geoalkalibacter sp.]|uniref:thermonuclease family protein n=1 Tax=Geoalkalibacter sp. TaxID=3041440 RepID=UPI00272E5A5C|nr:thermonuclease family protein [Geoalkalibacter sp.]
MPGLTRTLVAPLAILLFVLLGQTLVACGAETRGRVSWIHDGDTLEIEGLGRVRLLGIDVPENRDSHRDRFYQERFGIAPPRLRQTAADALQFNIRHAKGQVVSLRFDGERRDRHGRLLAYVILPDGRNLNRLLVEEGLAGVYRRFDFSLKEDFLRAEDEARGRKKGMWAEHEGRSPSRRSALRVSSILVSFL